MGVLATCSGLGAPVAVQGPIEAFGTKTAGLSCVRLAFTHTYWSGGRRTQTGQSRVWFDKKGGRYLVVDRWRSEPAGGRVRSWAQGVLVDAKGATTWLVREGQATQCRRYPAAGYLPREDALVSNRYVRSCTLDALFGYRNLCRVFRFKPAKCPLAEGGALSWFTGQVDPGARERKQFEWMGAAGNRTWFGFEARSGWLRVVVTDRAHNWRSISRLTEVQAEPETRGVFVLPDEVRGAPVIDGRTGEAFLGGD